MMKYKNQKDKPDIISRMKAKAAWVKKETLLIHKISQETRIASSLSCLEIFVTLYYGDILKYDAGKTDWESRDRFIISKGHGAISLYPILADLGYFDVQELRKVGKPGCFLGGIPDCIIPGFETTNGSLGHGLGVACGIAMALKSKGRDEKVFVLLGDGELYEGSVWEAVMFAGEHGLDNLIAIVDNNKICMLDYCRNILDLDPLKEKFEMFKWEASKVDGHNIAELHKKFLSAKNSGTGRPKLIIADTVKGNSIPGMENDPLCHIKNLKEDEIDLLVGELE